MIVEGDGRGRHQLIAYAMVVIVMVVGFFGVSRALRVHSHDIQTIRSQGRQIHQTILDLHQTVRDLDALEKRVTANTCVRINKLQDGLVGFIDDTLSRAKRSVTATIASPSASNAEKAAAQANLAQIIALHNAARNRFPDQDCSVAVQAGSATTTVPRA